TNKATAAPVNVSRAHLASTGGRAAAVVVNSGCANAATGARGDADAERMCALVAADLGCDPSDVLVCSTGLIGYFLPMAEVEKGTPPLVAARRSDGGAEAARAIMTTDTVPKEVTVAGDGYTVGGMAKGAAMLAPNMATMLAVLTTDAVAEPHELRAALVAAVEGSFNRIVVDGCTSTNDTVIILANGRSGRPLDPGVLSAACLSLAAQMVEDAEGATKVAQIHVRGAASDAEAHAAARKIAESQLVQCSLYGQDPYWGRIVSEVGSAGVTFDIDTFSVAYGDIEVCRDGVAADHDEAAVKAHLAGRHVAVTADLGLGEGMAVMLTSDLTPGYIDENMRTS
ncbi:MAG: glutamate N-acetyltransferase / amino-acid N-acetyltransferase, partial [Actinomycetota bacterium]|nr:glutamate N-acetyltransferase / amino-acid N-acetyltransferase [Actinomycetota bacterium]